MIDLTIEEETCAKAQLILSVTPNGELTLAKQIGKGSLELDSLTEMITIGVDVGMEFNATLSRILAHEENIPKKISVGFLGLNR